MKTFAIVTSNTVSNIIMADNKEETELALNCVLIEYTTDNPAGIGWTYDVESGRFIGPPLLLEMPEEAVEEFIEIVAE